LHGLQRGEIQVVLVTQSFVVIEDIFQGIVKGLTVDDRTEGKPIPAGIGKTTLEKA